MNGDAFRMWNAKAYLVKPMYMEAGCGYGHRLYRSDLVFPRTGRLNYRNAGGVSGYFSVSDAAAGDSVSTSGFGSLGQSPAPGLLVAATTMSNPPKHRRCQPLARIIAGVQDGFLFLDGDRCAVERALVYVVPAMFSSVQYFFQRHAYPQTTMWAPSTEIEPLIHVLDDWYVSKAMLGMTIDGGQPSVLHAVAAWTVPVRSGCYEESACFFKTAAMQSLANRGILAAGAAYRWIGDKCARYFDWRQVVLPTETGIARVGQMNEDGTVTIAAQSVVPKGLRYIDCAVVADSHEPSEQRQFAATFGFSTTDSEFITTDQNSNPEYRNRQAVHVPTISDTGHLYVTLRMPYVRPHEKAAAMAIQQVTNAVIASRPQQYQSMSMDAGFMHVRYACRGIQRGGVPFLVPALLDMCSVWPLSYRGGWMSVPAMSSGSNGRQLLSHERWQHSYHEDTASNYSIAGMQDAMPALDDSNRPPMAALSLQPRPSSSGETLYEATPTGEVIKPNASAVASLAFTEAVGPFQPHARRFGVVDHGQPVTARGKKIVGVRVTFAPWIDRPALLGSGAPDGIFINESVQQYETPTPPTEQLSFGANTYSNGTITNMTGKVPVPNPFLNPSNPDTRELPTGSVYLLNNDYDFIRAVMHNGPMSAEQERISTCLEQARMPHVWNSAPTAGAVPYSIQSHRAVATADTSLLAPAPLTGQYECRSFAVGNVSSCPGFFRYKGVGQWSGRHSWTLRSMIWKYSPPSAWKLVPNPPSTQPNGHYEPDASTARWDAIHVPFTYDCSLRTEHLEMYAAVTWSSQEAGTRTPTPTGPTEWKWYDLVADKGRCSTDFGSFSLTPSSQAVLDGTGMVAYPHQGELDKPRATMSVSCWVRSVMKGAMQVQWELPAGMQTAYPNSHTYDSDIKNRVGGNVWPDTTPVWDRPDNTPSLAPMYSANGQSILLPGADTRFPDLSFYNSHEMMHQHRAFCMHFNAEQTEQLLAGATVMHTKWRSDGYGSANPQVFNYTAPAYDNLEGIVSGMQFGDPNPQKTSPYPPAFRRSNQSPLPWGNDSRYAVGAPYGARSYAVSVSLIME